MQLAFRFGQPSAGLAHTHDFALINLSNPVLAGRVEEPWTDISGEGHRCGRLTLWHSGAELWGAGFAEVAEGNFEGAALALYAELFHAAGQLTLQRIWNFIPRINEYDGRHRGREAVRSLCERQAELRSAAPTSGLENYRAFCRGRHAALESHYGAADERHMPAASAVGTGGDRLCAVFVAGRDPVTHVENPQQVPAYRYPSRYGPTAPSFARGSLVQRAAGPRLYVSGTASIRHSESQHDGDVAAQCELALANMDLVARAAGLAGLERSSPGRRAFRVYVRQPDDWPIVQRVLQRRLWRADDDYSALQADICRRELLVEIEACVDADAAAGDPAS